MKPQVLLLGSLLITTLFFAQISFAAENSTKLSSFSNPTDNIPLPNEVNQPYSWIKSMQLDNGLIESAEGTDFVSLYDNALAALVFTLNNDRSSTERILDYFNQRMDTEFTELGGGFYQFRKGDGSNTRSKWIGDNAWLLIAIQHYADRFDADRYAPMAQALEEWLRAQQDEDGGLWGGYRANGNRIHKITEGIITAFNAVEGYDAFHKGILKYLKENRWDTQESLLLAWPENPKYKYAMDLHTLGSLIYPSMSKQLLAQVYRYDTEQNASVSGKKISGFCFDEDQDVIWLEGTAQMALAFRKSGMEEEGLELLNEIQKTRIKSNTTKNIAGIPYAVNQGSNYGTEKLWDHAHSQAAISSSAWYIFAQLNFNPFELKGEKDIPAADRFWMP